MRLTVIERWIAVGIAALSLLTWATPVHAQSRRVELSFTPTARAQLAVYIECAETAKFQTVRLTQAVAVRGIGNRPGALQMNSGYHWPYGRREGVLPIWAHRRLAYGSSAFPRVIFNGRNSEGNASSAGSRDEPGNTADDYFCLSFTAENSDRDHLDAVSCASQFASNKGRYATPEDVAAGYAEPFEDAPATGSMRLLSQTSLYPPRRDVVVCTEPGCGDHVDVSNYASDARSVMPEIDAVTMATPSGMVEQRIVFDVPRDWPNADCEALVEINVEGDYNDTFSDATYPTPVSPSGMWDYWAGAFGYPYRGQPSVLFRVPFTLSPAGGTWSTDTPAGYGALHGEDGEIRTMDASITNNPDDAAGSGADRLVEIDGARLTVHVPRWDACRQPDPPASCGLECSPTDPNSCGPNLLCTDAGRCVGLCDGPGADAEGCGHSCDPDGPETCGLDLLCADDGLCVSECEIPMQPSAVADLTLRRHDNRRFSHQYAHVRFSVPESARGIARYEMRVGTEPIVDVASFERALPAVQATPEGAELMLPITGSPGDVIEADFGGMLPELRYYVGIRAFDECNAHSEIATAEITTTDIYFTTVTPCFVATAAYGTPLASEIGVLRQFRDRHLMTNAMGRALVDAYYTVGPIAADVIRDQPWLRAAVRALLTPVIALLR